MLLVLWWWWWWWWWWCLLLSPLYFAPCLKPHASPQCAISCSLVAGTSFPPPSYVPLAFGLHRFLLFFLPIWHWSVGSGGGGQSSATASLFSVSSSIPRMFKAVVSPKPISSYESLSLVGKVDFSLGVSPGALEAICQDLRGF